MITRLPDWKPRLIWTLNARRAQPYEVGQTDCVCFMVSVVEALTGVRPLEVTWRNLDEGLDLIKRHGYERSFGVNHLLGQPSTDWRLLRFGDLARLPPHPDEVSGAETYGVCVGGGQIMTPGLRHLELAPASQACRVWRVGNV